MKTTPHHIGCAVRDAQSCHETWARAFGLQRRTRSFNVASQAVSVCFVELAPRFYLELVSPLEEHGRLQAYVKVGFYHLCFLVDDLDDARGALKAQHFSALPAFESEAFAGRRCQFFLTPQLHLVELAHMSPHEFDEFFEASLQKP